MYLDDDDVDDYVWNYFGGDTPVEQPKETERLRLAKDLQSTRDLVLRLKGLDKENKLRDHIPGFEDKIKRLAKEHDEALVAEIAAGYKPEAGDYASSGTEKADFEKKVKELKARIDLARSLAGAARNLSLGDVFKGYDLNKAEALVTQLEAAAQSMNQTRTAYRIKILELRVIADHSVPSPGVVADVEKNVRASGPQIGPAPGSVEYNRPENVQARAKERRDSIARSLRAEGIPQNEIVKFLDDLERWERVEGMFMPANVPGREEGSFWVALHRAGGIRPTPVNATPRLVMRPVDPQQETAQRSALTPVGKQAKEHKPTTPPTILPPSPASVSQSQAPTVTKQPGREDTPPGAWIEYIPGKGYKYGDQIHPTLQQANAAARKMAPANKPFSLPLVYTVVQGKLVPLNSCFAAGTLLYTPQGYRTVECLRVGEELYSRSEDDAGSEVLVKCVEAVFVRTGRIWILTVRGQEIRTTGEHPFWVLHRGWVTVSELIPGDQLSSHDGQWVTVEKVEDTGEYETVYNVRVADFHTYFVGSLEWGFSVWRIMPAWSPARSPTPLRPVGWA